MVQHQHTNSFSDEKRTIDSLRRKFAALHRRKNHTKGPYIPYLGDGAESDEVADVLLPSK